MLLNKKIWKFYKFTLKESISHVCVIIKKYVGELLMKKKGLF